MAAAVQTNLSVAFTHGAQLTMDHCGALIHGAAILWSRLLSQLPQETLLLCTPASEPLTPFRWALVLRLETPSCLFLCWEFCFLTLKRPGFMCHTGVALDWVAALREHAASAGCMHETFERLDSHMPKRTHVYPACAYRLKCTHGDAGDKFSKVLGGCVCGNSFFFFFAYVCVCVGVLLSAGIFPVVAWWLTAVSCGLVELNALCNGLVRGECFKQCIQYFCKFIGYV